MSVNLQEQDGCCLYNTGPTKEEVLCLPQHKQETQARRMGEMVQRLARCMRAYHLKSYGSKTGKGATVFRPSPILSIKEVH